MIHIFNITNDTLNGAVDLTSLQEEILESTIKAAFSTATVSDNDLTITFKEALDTEDVATLGQVIANHTGIATEEAVHTLDSDGSEVVRYKVSKIGRHYQAHSVEFETCSLDGLYNKDRDGVDLNYSDVKFYDTNGVELTTQNDLDSSCVKTVMEWRPTYDFEIISGQIRQIERVQSDAYIYVEAIVPTGMPAPYDKVVLPFVHGGINLQYIGADEILKTDGRASKELKGTLGQHFKCTINHAAGVNHKLSVIYEIYKDPIT